MKFKDPKSKAELERAHPAIQAAVVLFSDWSRASHLPEPVITDVMDDGLRKGKFTWHDPKRMCAVDFRTSIYSQSELEAVVKWFKCRFSHPHWELITETHGTGPHIHLARRDTNFKPVAKELEHGPEGHNS